MSGMNNRVWNTGWLLILLSLVGTTANASGTPAQNAAIEFVARATPSAGLEEPVRGFPFFVLSKSFLDIEKEAEANFPKPDLDAFIAKQDLSPELKAWMKKNQWVSLAGEDFIHKLHADDILNVPEFKTAYMDRNASDQSADFPQPKFKASDQAKNPAKFDKLSKDYVDAIRHYIEAHPDSIDGIDLGLAEKDPSPKWNSILGARVTSIHQRALDLARSSYLVAHAETNLQGEGFVRGLGPGTYWLSTLDVPATVGDARPQWDVPVTLRAGETKYITLSNSNSVRAQAAK
jgi:hypothetical protein